MSHQPPERRDRDVIVTERDGANSATPVVVAILGVLAVLFILWLLFFTGDADRDIEVDLPDNPDVEIEQDPEQDMNFDDPDADDGDNLDDPDAEDPEN